MAAAERDTRKYEIIDEGRYVLTRKLNLIDEMLLRFAAVVVRHCPCVLTTGSNDLLEGKSEETEGFTILVPKLGEDEFSILYDDLLASGFWCIIGEDAHGAFAELADDLGVRFAAEDTVDPTITLLFTTSPDEKEALMARIEVSSGKGTLFIARELKKGPPVHGEEDQE